MIRYSFSLIIPVGREQGRMNMTKEIAQLDYPGELLETLFIAGDDPPGRKRNNGAAQARGDYLVFLDDDLELPRDFLVHLNVILTEQQVPIVGGANIGFKKANLVQRMTDIAFASPLGFGKGNVRFRNSGQARPGSEDNLTACLLCIKRDIFLQNEGFDNALYPGEEIELIRRMKEKEIVMVFDPSLFVYHQRRATLGTLFTQIYRYGKGRIKVWSQRQFRRADISYLLPMFFVLYFLLLPLVSLYVPWFAVGAACYMLILAFTVIKAGIGNKLSFSGMVVLAIVFIYLHLSYGTGLLVELIRQFHLSSSSWNRKWYKRTNIKQRDEQ
jgi:glycosyltransferase involved in cell wall biosynthesis